MIRQSGYRFAEKIMRLKKKQSGLDSSESSPLCRRVLLRARPLALARAGTHR
jgi:hypothetical protein